MHRDDDDLVVTSQNLLSVDPLNRLEGIDVHLRDVGVATDLADRRTGRSPSGGWRNAPLGRDVVSYASPQGIVGVRHWRSSCLFSPILSDPLATEDDATPAPA